MPFSLFLRCSLKGGSFPCPETWKFYKSNCYYRSNTALSWQNARDSCRRTANADLLYIASAAENAFVVNLLSGIAIAWFGYNDINVERKFVWSKANVTSSYTNWFPREPNNQGGNEDCAEMYVQSPRGSWNDNQCYVQRPFVCKMPGTDMIYAFVLLIFKLVLSKHVHTEVPVIHSFRIFYSDEGHT